MSVRLHCCWVLVTFMALPATAEEAIVDRVRPLIQAQYDAMDAAMVQQPYSTRSIVARRDNDPREEITTFRPDRPPGERERLETVNGEPPDRSDQRRFNRRPQPDERDDQPIRLQIDYDTLHLLEQQDDQLRLGFSTVLLLDGEESDYGRLFRGELIWDDREEFLVQVDMHLTEAFSYRFFNLEGFTVSETFRKLDGRLVRDEYSHDIELRNRLLDLSNTANIEFIYDTDDV
ncbi:MAG: hypothetical protein LAT62_07670 [Natronospirillum sp.]|uniref:hypothetical protein n=1 Tax=Natronospirillum sp. TaxID=2812955 RepID=UPI0025FFF6CA|nr:hypothetical protein [Natronospirillum sp.]MCH8551798.1 hypothetical protein [Natronospirillum sp.]